MKRVLILSQSYSPDIIGIAKYTAELAEGLVASGWQIEVICPAPFYPQWRTRPGYSQWAWSREEIKGVLVHRVPAYIPHRPNGVRRLIHLASFALTASVCTLLRSSVFRPERVLVIEPTLAVAPAALLSAYLLGSETWLHVQDFEVDAAFKLGFLRGNFLRRVAVGIEKKILSLFDNVSTISDAMQKKLLEKGVQPDRVKLIRNWANLEAFDPHCTGANLRTQLKIPDERVVAVYSGNMAEKQGLSILADVARQLCNQDIHFIFCGSGPYRGELERLCAGLENVSWLELQPVEEFGILLAAADVHLMPQRAEASDLVLPSKLSGMLASGRPIIAGADPGTGVAQEIVDCGIIVKPEDASAMASAIMLLAADPELRRGLGAVARRRAEEGWNFGSALAVFRDHLT